VVQTNEYLISFNNLGNDSEAEISNYEMITEATKKAEAEWDVRTLKDRNVE